MPLPGYLVRAAIRHVTNEVIAGTTLDKRTFDVPVIHVGVKRGVTCNGRNPLKLHVYLRLCHDFC